eukprot:TRINITY_DN80283_c0_g1_i1.p1 TRINITY_DN80283_c0_g1~~TRINITY_DN80283_c0_g1_i1.p1  ORF type:complete len:390 (+),score=52.51 TRINITY_DN80283_c0_g1_i1:274-1443(+)
MAPELEVHAKHELARAATFHLPRHPIRTPVFMPVGTQGTIKGLTSAQLEKLDLDIILGNTYHLGLRPGERTMAAVGGLHKLMSWNRNILTDSGGFQMVSLLQLAQITEEGVTFQSSHDGSMITLTPERSIELQNTIGSDIMMQLDDVVHVLTTGPRVEEAMHRSIRWLDRCIAANKSTEKQQQLFAIIQGGLNPELRTACIEEMVKRDAHLGGYAIGGLSGGEAKDDFWRIVAHCTARLPKHKPRYCMGVGYPEDLVVCSALGVDMFDCVFPCRTARFGTALTSFGRLHLKSSELAKDFDPLDPDCTCFVCKTYTRSYLHSTLREEATCSLVTYHNLHYLKHLMASLREAIINNNLPQFVQVFMRKYFGSKEYPQWIRDALNHVKIILD